MGAPLHLIRDKVAAHGVRVFSSNYTLYGDISRRVVEVYETFSPVVEVYSIDESFLDFGGFRDREVHAQEMRRQVLLQVGVPVRVGIGPTKTLAKCANEVAKHTLGHRSYLILFLVYRLKVLVLLNCSKQGYVNDGECPEVL